MRGAIARLSAVLLIGCVLACTVPSGNIESSPATPLAEYSCFFLMSGVGIEPEIMEVPSLRVLHFPEDQPHFVVETDGKARVEAVMCQRSRAEFVLSDDRVVAAGFPLYIQGPERTLVLERTPVGYRVRQTAGRRLNSREQDDLVKLISALNNRARPQ